MSDQPKVSERMRALVRALLACDREAERCNVVTHDLVLADMDLLSAIAELEQRAEKAEQERDKWKEAAAALFCFSEASAIQLASEDKDSELELEYKVNLAWGRALEAAAALGPLWDEAVK